MIGLLKWIFFLTVGCIQAHGPRRLVFNQLISPVDDMTSKDERIECYGHHCFVDKRSQADQDENGPFWANRGKKDPTYQQEALYVEEPYWVLVRRNDRFQEQPFFVPRGKKGTGPSLGLRDRRELPVQGDSPFFAARGRRAEAKD